MKKSIVRVCVLAICLMGGWAVAAEDPYEGNPGPEMLRYESELKTLIKNGVKEKDALKQIKKLEAAKPKTYEEHKQTEDTIDAAAKNVMRAAEPPGPLDWIRVRKTYEGDGYQKAALFSYSHTPADDVYTADAAVIFDIWAHEFGGWHFEYQASSDIKISSEKPKSANRIKNRLTSIIYREEPLAVAPLRMTDVLFFPSVLHETDRDFDTQNVLGEFLVEPAFDFGSLKLNLQTNIFLSGRKIGRYELGPSFGLEGGSTVKDSDGKSPENGGFLRPLVRMRLTFAPAWGDGKLSFFANETIRFLSADDYDAYNNFDTGVEYEVTKHVTVSLAYAVGYDAPVFEKIEQLKIGLGVKF